MAELHFPGIDSAAADWLVERRVGAVGIDTPSIDYGQTNTYPTHRVLFAANIPAFENVANLDRLPARGGYVVALADEDQKRQRRAAPDRRTGSG